MVGENDELMAYHEAGHIVAAFLNGVEFYSVTVEPSGEELGYAEIRNPFHAWKRGNGTRRAALEKHLIGIFSGPAAESLFTGKKSNADSEDEDAARYWLEQSPPPSCAYIGDGVFEAYLRRMRMRARILMRDNWSLVEDLAETLAILRTMDRETILAKLHPNTDSGPLANPDCESQENIYFF